MIEQLIEDHFKNLGYLDVSVNNWKGRRIYVNLTEDTSFSYDLTQDYKVTSDVLLDDEIFKEAVKAIYQVKRRL